ncbi:MAG: PD40 domain-containing protein [SAR324 cluster bacterium]|nr:PD40 domain-containing protein [SAR324 cluster bacterium]
MLLRYLTAGLLYGLLIVFPFTSMGQAYSPDVVHIEGLKFSRFVLSVKPLTSFMAHFKSRTWLKLIEKNLCWSGVFKLYHSQNNYCRISSGHQDFQIHLKVLAYGKSKSLQFIVTDNIGIPLFDTHVKLLQNKLTERQIMKAINYVTEKITMRPGILGSTIAFSYKQPKKLKVIARVNTHGQYTNAISFNQQTNIAPRWSPSGDKIVYTTVSRQGTSILLDDLQRNASVLAKYKGINSGGSWYANGKKIIITLSKDGNADLYAMELKTYKLERLTHHPAIDTSPALSPDGKFLLFVSDRSQSEQIYVMHIPTREVSRLTFIGPRNTDPAWSPDGSLIAFTKYVRGRDQIYIMDAYGENGRAITRSSYPAEQPAWSPDGRQIIFASRRGTNYKLYIIFLDGGGLRRLTHSPAGYEEKSPSWTLRQF